MAEFLTAQRERLAPSTYARYEGIIDLFRDCLNNYGYQSLTGAEAWTWQPAFDADDEETFTWVCGSAQDLAAVAEDAVDTGSGRRLCQGTRRPSRCWR